MLIDLVLHHNLDVLFNIQPVMSQVVSVTPLSQAEDSFTFTEFAVITEFAKIPAGPFLQPVYVPLDGSSAIEQSQFPQIWHLNKMGVVLFL